MGTRKRVLLLSAAVALAGCLAVVPAIATTSPATVHPAYSCGYYNGDGPVRAGGTYPDKRVAEVQCLINENTSWTSYNPPLPVNGIADRATVRALITVQNHAGLASDGIVGPETWHALRTGVWW
ncbi:peptidoglycan-binding domain-containing protein [Streptomyces javensis]|uniref:Peptidoglycan binding-like domain-containing protein n=1 Tax=Streptomyces javensis TaxID=114698 RepID=A0ABN1X6Q0_9ACTN